MGKYKRWAAILAVLLVVVAIAASAGAPVNHSVTLEAMQDSGLVLEGVVPGADMQAVEAAGITFLKQPFAKLSLPDLNRDSVTWQTDHNAVSFSLRDIPVQNALFQFINQRLENITLNLNTKEDAAAAEALLRDTYGEPEVMEMQGQDEMMSLLYWQMARGRAALSKATAGDRILRANVQFTFALDTP